MQRFVGNLHRRGRMPSKPENNGRDKGIVEMTKTDLEGSKKTRSPERRCKSRLKGMYGNNEPQRELPRERATQLMLASADTRPDWQARKVTAEKLRIIATRFRIGIKIG
jgi:hypothetical protein